MHIFLTLIVALFFSSCQPTPKKEKEQKLVINLREEPQTLDPRRARDLKDLTLMRMLFEGLTRVGKEEKAELALAKEIDISPDLKTYIFHLRSSKWNNGDALVAEDFAYAWKKILDPAFPADYAAQLYVIKNAKAAKQGKIAVDEVKVQALDALTLKVELEEPTPYFLELLSVPAFFPVNKRVDIQTPKWAESPTTYVSNGPFFLAEWKHQDFLKARKSPTYWDKASVALNEIELIMVQEETEFKMFEKQEIAWAGSPISTLPVDALKSLKEKNLVQTKPNLGTHFLRVNVDHAPFQHPWLRWAFAIAINRQAIIDHVIQGNQLVATGIVPSSMQLQTQPYFQDGDTVLAHELFKAALKELNWHTLPEITLTYMMTERNHLIVQAIQQQWFETFGIRIKLEGVERKVYFDRISKHDYQISVGSWMADFNDPINFLENFKYKTASTNNTEWESPAYIQVLDQSGRLHDAQERKALLSQGERILMDAMPAIPLFHYTLLYMKDPHLQDVVLTSMGTIDFKWARFDD